MHEVTGKVKLVGETETFPSGFSKRLLIVEVESGQYVNPFGFEFTKDKVSLLDSVNVGDEVTVSIFDVGTRANYFEAKDKWFPNFPNAFKIEVSGKAEAPPASAPPADFTEEEQDIPF